MADVKTFFLNEFNLSEDALSQLVRDALHGADDGELFLENTQNQALSLEDSQVKTTALSDSRGMGLRRIDGEFAGLVHANQLSVERFKQAAAELNAITRGTSHIHTLQGPTPRDPLYDPINPLLRHTLDERITLMNKVDAYVRDTHANVRQVFVRLNNAYQEVMIVRPDGRLMTDIRPLTRFDIQVVVEGKNGLESGHYGFGGRRDDATSFQEAEWQAAADEAVRQAHVKLDARPAPAGEMPVVMGAGWSGVLFHEAVGHGLEGDYNRKGTSAFSGRIGEQVAAKGVTVVDDGTLPGRRGSLTIDDEGTPSQRNVLIEDGILKGYMQDRLNARLMGVPLTGNGRRESYACPPLPRMTNTYLTGGQDDPEDILKSTKKGIFAKNFGGGQVDITSGNYVFEVSEAYLIEDGQITAPIKGATLIGNGPNSIQYIDRIAHDMALDKGIGICGKSGQGVPVGVGQPTLRLNGGVTVGGTDG